MALELIAKLLEKLPVQSGQSARGAWSKQEFVLETQENYPRKVCASVWGADKVSELAAVAEGETVKISFNLESRQFNERWYTDVRAWRIERFAAHSHESAGGVAPSSAPLSYSDPGYLDKDTPSDIDDLPF